MFLLYLFASFGKYGKEKGKIQCGSLISASFVQQNDVMCYIYQTCVFLQFLIAIGMISRPFYIWYFTYSISLAAIIEIILILSLSVGIITSIIINNQTQQHFNYATNCFAKVYESKLVLITLSVIYGSLGILQLSFGIILYRSLTPIKIEGFKASCQTILNALLNRSKRETNSTITVEPLIPANENFSHDSKLHNDNDENNENKKNDENNHKNMNRNLMNHDYGPDSSSSTKMEKTAQKILRLSFVSGINVFISSFCAAFVILLKIVGADDVPWKVVNLVVIIIWDLSMFSFIVVSTQLLSNSKK